MSVLLQTGKCASALLADLRRRRHLHRSRFLERRLSKTCQTCGRLLNVTADPLSADCGGDCWGCVGVLEAEGWQPSAEKVAVETAAGLREPDGSPKPPMAGSGS